MLANEPHLFVFGLGYVGLHAASAAIDLGWRVSGSCRSAERAALLQEAVPGLSVHTFDLDEEYTGLSTTGVAALTDATHVLATVPPVADLDRDPLLALHGDVLRAAPRLEWAGYLSTTGVYGDHAGAWVDERAATRAPPGSGAALRLPAEQAWLALREEMGGRLRSHVFRLSGIYGPGRSALKTVAKQGLAPQSPPAASAASPPKFVSRVHVADICGALLASMHQPTAALDNATYNLSDDEPAPREEVMLHAAGLLGLETAALPDGQAASPRGGERARRRATENKRVDNGRMRRELLPAGRLRFPTYREGLADCYRQEQEAVEAGVLWRTAATKG